ncbi:hypothetical protein SS7213T_04826 [Staphylococcus simiae CCM 7213 = CCUG 51256]|uniref:Uncharacterized protein n=1 Tax=Staphylococcus simiae CCM 7213 = CCUG 51256 TaxID=911238 RepID=G5JHN3_9STAP|nr:hypothetical protein SS7213T_04826 [Staphylococcus simiae CCM 7213 = CCUG 51256]
MCQKGKVGQKLLKIVNLLSSKCARWTKRVKIVNLLSSKYARWTYLTIASKDCISVPVVKEPKLITI